MFESSPKSYRGSFIVFGAPTVVGLWFVSSFALNYLSSDSTRFGIYAPRREWLMAHVAAGIAALLLGPAQLWLGLNHRTKKVHRIAGIAYVAAVAVSGTAAFYLASHTDFGWVFGMGLSTMAGTWMLATSLAILAIISQKVQQHREWMIRSYVLTFAFVTIRVAEAILDVFKGGSLVDRMTAAAWLGWTIPLVVTEALLQGHKILARPVTAVQMRVVSAESVAPEPMAFDLQGSESSYLHRP
jgi:uncharacterized membrane protein